MVTSGANTANLNRNSAASAIIFALWRASEKDLTREPSIGFLL